MILPQSKTFNILKTRLDCINITNNTLPFVKIKPQLELVIPSVESQT